MVVGDGSYSIDNIKVIIMLMVIIILMVIIMVMVIIILMVIIMVIIMVLHRYILVVIEIVIRYFLSATNQLWWYFTEPGVSLVKVNVEKVYIDYCCLLNALFI